MAHDAKTQPTVNGSPLLVTVVHGSTASTARPAGVTVVQWIGSVFPSNSVDGDEWLDTSATAGALSLISTTTLGVAAASVTFSSIPQTFTSLLLELQARSAVSGADNDSVVLALNGDTTDANYDRQVVRGAGATASAFETLAAANSRVVGIVPGATSPANASGTMDLSIRGYTSALQKIVQVQNMASTARTTGKFFVDIHGHLWASTAAITSLALSLSSASNFVAGSVFSLYGLV